MALSKQDVMDDLQKFMHGFAYSINRLYGRGDALLALLWGVPPEDAEAWVTEPEACNFSGSHLWWAVSTMYDFGIAALPSTDLGAKNFPLDGAHADAELFLRRLPALEEYLGEDDVWVPTRVIRTVETAVARHLLEGGTRYADLEATDGYAPDHLTIREMALLADMDERSVRNASNPKLSDPLKTTSIEKRTMVDRDEAKRWLSGRKGYVPLCSAAGKLPSPEASNVMATLTVSAEVAERLSAAAVAEGLSIDALIQRLLRR